MAEITILKSHQIEDGSYDIDGRLPISTEQWEEIIADIANNDIEAWALLSAFYKSKEQSAYLDEIIKTLGKTKPGDEFKTYQFIDSLGRRIAERVGGFRIVRKAKPDSEVWWPVLFYLSVTGEANKRRQYFTLRGQVAALIGQRIKKDKSSTSVKREKVGDTICPNAHYFELGLNRGDVLTYIPKPEIKATVASDRQLMYDGNEYSRTALAKALHINNSLGSWECNGKNLQELYDAVYERIIPEGKTEEQCAAERAERRAARKAAQQNT